MRALFALPPLAEAPAPYSAIEVDPFVADRGIAFPADYQKVLVEDIAREASVIFQTVIIVRQGDAPPFGHAVLRISGTVIRFRSNAKGLLPGFGSSGISVRAQVRFADASSGQVLLIRQAKGTIDPKGPATALPDKSPNYAKRIVFSIRSDSQLPLEFTNDP